MEEKNSPKNGCQLSCSAELLSQYTIHPYCAIWYCANNAIINENKTRRIQHTMKSSISHIIFYPSVLEFVEAFTHNREIASNVYMSCGVIQWMAIKSYNIQQQQNGNRVVGKISNLKQNKPLLKSFFLYILYNTHTHTHTQYQNKWLLLSMSSSMLPLVKFTEIAYFTITQNCVYSRHLVSK